MDSYGGSQYVDSVGTGRYHTYFCEDVVGFVDAHYRTLADPAHRGIQGKSSGGFGAMITPMLRPDLFGALASHAGDTLYELCYGTEIGKAARLLRAWGSSVERWWEELEGNYIISIPWGFGVGSKLADCGARSTRPRSKVSGSRYQTRPARGSRASDRYCPLRRSAPRMVTR